MSDSKLVVSSYRLFERFSRLQKSSVAQSVGALVVPDLRLGCRFVRRGFPPPQEKPTQQRNGDDGKNKYAQVWSGTAGLLDYRGEGAGRMSSGLAIDSVERLLR